MSTQTTNYGLTKPENTDYYDISVFNNNADIIDAALKNKADQAEVDALKKSVSDGKTLVANAITGQGVTTATDATFATMATNIGTVATNKYNAGVSATKKGTAAAAQVLTGYTFTNASSVGASGTMVNNGAVSQALAINGTYTIPAGYHNGSGKVTQNITTKAAATYTPGDTAQTIASGQYLSGAQTISAVPTETKNVTAGTAATTVSRTSGKYMTSVTVNPTPSQTKTVTMTTSPLTVTPDSGKLLSSVTINASLGRKYASGTGTILTEQISGANSLKYREYVYSNAIGESYLIALYINLGIAFTPSVVVVRYYNSSKAKYFKSCIYAGQNLATSVSEDMSYNSIYWYGNSTSSAADNKVFLSGTKLLLPISYSDFNYGWISNLTWEAWE